ncbi:T-cell defective protein 2 [Caenorhabditis elegans]|nr:T-cell defective protein 2 [Caenorhabditis elegans]CDH93007.1 T-cell defective protein 2 [Caenorhabditis elegans]|eukprot:NP_001294305.1 T-cell defective protein 2 [Caenorhabditis elegans]
MAPTTSTFNAQPRLSLDSGLGLTNDSFYSTDLNETHLMDISAGNASTSFQSQPPPQLESSPPTKWARIRTPPNRKKKISHEGPNQEALPPGFNLFSPPSRKKIKTAFSSPPPKSMKTPDSLRKSIRISSPSPFKVTFSKTPLKLSNNENVTGIHIGRSGTYYNKQVTGSASKRCLLPSKPDGFTFLGSPGNSDVLDFPLQTTFEGFGDLDTPAKINAALEVNNDDSMDYYQYAGMIETSSSLATYTNSTGPLVENHARNLKSVPISRTASRNLMKISRKSVEEPVPEPQAVHVEPVIEKPTKISAKKEKEQKKSAAKEAALKEAKEKEMRIWKLAPFETPKKEVPLYSGRWLVISTGRTLAQQELFSDAKSFFKANPPPAPRAPQAPELASGPRRIPTIQRVTLFKHRYRSPRD